MNIAEKYADYILDETKKILDIDSPSGYTRNVAEYVIEEYSKLGYKAEMTVKGGVLVDLGGEGSNDAVMIDTHIDTLGGMVSEIKSNGNLRIVPIGGLNANNTEAENVRVITRDGKIYTGVFQLDNASVHVNKAYSDTKRSFACMEVLLDEMVAGKDDTKKLGIDIGDIVCFDPRTVITPSGYIKSRFLDDKLSVGILLAFAKLLKDEKLKPKIKLYQHVTVYEEVGHGAAATVPDGVKEIISVDMGCVGDGLQCKETQVSICAKDSAGPYNYDVVTALVNTAKANDIDYAVDIYPYYGSDVDVTLKSGHDVRHGLIGAGVYASHGYERSHKAGAFATLKLLASYLI